MHTRRHGDTTFNFNSDLSGYVSIAIDGRMIEVPGDDLLEFVAEWVANEKRQALQDLDAREVLGLKASK